MIYCPTCKKKVKEVKEITDGMWITYYMKWNEKKKRYEEIGHKEDGAGETYIECAECGTTLDFDDYQKTDPQYK